MFIDIRKQEIRKKLKELDLSQENLALLLGHKSKTHMSELINGIKPFTLKDLIIINRLLKVEITKLVPVYLSKEDQIKDIAYQVVKQIDKMPPIADNEIKKYVNRILEDMSAEELQDFLQHKFSYTDLIKKKINELADIEAEKTFLEWLTIDRITTQGIWKFEPAIIPSKTGNDIGNSLYTHEGDMNGLEQQFIMEIANSSNISFWHRNLGRGKGFSLNGFKSNHYPDFIIVTKTNRVIVVETKGSDRDNSDSSAKLRLGKAWEKNTNSTKYKYMMVFDKNAIDGAFNLEEAISLISKM